MGYPALRRSLCAYTDARTLPTRGWTQPASKAQPPPPPSPCCQSKALLDAFCLYFSNFCPPQVLVWSSQNQRDSALQRMHAEWNVHSHHHVLIQLYQESWSILLFPRNAFSIIRPSQPQPPIHLAPTVRRDLYCVIWRHWGNSRPCRHCAQRGLGLGKRGPHCLYGCLNPTFKGILFVECDQALQRINFLGAL